MGLFDFLFKHKKYNEDLLADKYDQLVDKAYNATIHDDDISQLDDNEKVFFVLYTYNSEILNGGLCQFFVNSSRAYAPLVSEYLGIVGAKEHQKLYDDFVADNKIDLNDLSFFDFDDLSQYSVKANAYPFDDFDDSFGELPEMERYLEQFLKTKM